MTLTIPANDQNRRFIVAEYLVPAAKLTPPFVLHQVDADQSIPCQWETAMGGTIVRWVVPFLPAGKSVSFRLQSGQAPAKGGLSVKEDPGGWLAIANPDREITRYCFGPAFAKFNKPFFYPVIAQGRSVTRAYPMEKKAGEENDHVHHTSLWFSHGEVNQRDYWAKLPITHKRFIQKTSGPVYAKIVAENAWGEDLTEIQDVLILDAGQDVLMDWTIILRADNGPVVLGKTKEGGFAVRVATGLTSPDPGKAKQAFRSNGQMVDSLGNKGEPAIRDHAAPWADNFGQVDGQTVGIAIMNHPTSWRYPTNWHVRNYGLFAANAFFVQGEHRLKKGESITLHYRLFAHGGDPSAAKVQEVYAGYATAKVEAN
ncbi:MAG TPA: PmoA family protein [Tepidisphaeraceae bacterium]|nr:PmoA family protein [Tepidisphaeraceae bacterium]